MIKNIIFDMGNVLFDYDPNVPLDLYCPNDEAKRIIFKELFCGPEWVLRDKGLITLEDEFECIKERIPQEYWDALLNCIHNWTICMKPINKTYHLFEDLKQRDFNIFVLSNAADEFYSYFNKYYDPNDFTGIIVSYEVHLSKPDVELFKYALNSWSINPKETLFIDDNPDNILAAKKLGINSIQYCDNHDKILNYLSTN